MSKFSNISELLTAIEAGVANFNETLAFIDDNYSFSPVSFKNGQQINQKDENQGSAKVFGVAKLNQLDKLQTLSLFAEHYQAVLNTPKNNDHGNIRNFMEYGWEGIEMDTNPLTVISS